MKSSFLSFCNNKLHNFTRKVVIQKAETAQNDAGNVTGKRKNKV